MDEMQAIGVGFVSYKESLDLTTPTGRLMVHLLSAFAEFEREVIKERVKAGIAHAKSKGVKIGRPTPEFDRDELAIARERLDHSGYSRQDESEKIVCP